MTIKVLHVRVGARPAVVEISHELREMQRLVGGYVDCIGMSDGVDVWCNDEALLTNEPQPNRTVPGMAEPIYGDFFLARHDGNGNMVSLTEADIATYSAALR